MIPNQIQQMSQEQNTIQNDQQYTNLKRSTSGILLALLDTEESETLTMEEINDISSFLPKEIQDSPKDIIKSFVIQNKDQLKQDIQIENERKIQDLKDCMCR